MRTPPPSAPYTGGPCGGRFPALNPAGPLSPFEGDAWRKRARLLASRASDSLARDLNDEEAANVAEDLIAAALFAAAYLLSHPNQAALLGRLWTHTWERKQ